MRVETVESPNAAKAGRLDASYFVNEQRARLLPDHRGQTMLLGGDGGIGRVWKPARFRRAYAAAGEKSAAYIRPYDVFNYFPEAADWLSIKRTAEFDSYRLQEGLILQTCSGRNLGPAVLVDSYLAQFLVGDDIIRIEVPDARERRYLLAYLNSRAGRALLRRDKTGSVIDHISEGQVASQRIPVLHDEVVDRVVKTVAYATELRARARRRLQALIGSYEARLPVLERHRRLANGWTIDSQAVDGRLDAAYYEPLALLARSTLARHGGVPVAQVATVRKPKARYKTRYVDALHGRPILSGRQLLQSTPIALKYIAPTAFKDVREYELRRGWIAYPADGRAEEELGTPVLINSEREGWLASGHIGRIVPQEGVDVGWLFLALRSSHAQMQLKARASGSVVDSTYPKDMERVVLPPPGPVDTGAITGIWDDLGIAQRAEGSASQLIDEALEPLLLPLRS